MRVVLWVKVILFGIFAAIILSMLSLLIDGFVRPERALLFLDLTYVVYMLVMLIAAGSGLVISLAALLTRSKTVSWIGAVLVAVTISTGAMKGAYDTYSNAIFFDAPLFYADLIQVVLNLIIYASVASLIWKVFGKELSTRS
jgi:hypothetical protein